jgi:hypothetical protein
MICGRFACIIIYLTLFGFNPGYSWAAKSNLSSTNMISKKTLINQDAVISLKKNYSELQSQKTADQVQFAPQKLAHTWLKPELMEKAIAQDRSINPESPPEIDRLWYLGGMTLISAISLFLIWILFTKPRQKHKPLQDLPLANKQLKLSEAKGLSSKIAETQSDAGENDLPQDVALTELVDLNIAFGNPLKVKKSTVQYEVGQAEIPLTHVDVIQEFINDLQQLDNSNNTQLAQTAFKRQAIWKLAKAKNYYSIEPLLKVISQVGTADKNLILETVMQINQQSYQSINNELFAVLADENPEVRLKALRDLKNLYQFVSPVVTKIAQMQSDQDYEVRQTAIQLLRLLNASPLPTFYDHSAAEAEVDNLIVGKKNEENLHLVAYLLAELDAEK